MSPLACLAFALASPYPCSAQTSVSINMDYAEGRYGEAEKSSTWTMPLIIKHQMAPWSFKLNIPYVVASGLAASGGDRFSTTRQQQEGLGDVVATLGYTLHESDDGYRFDIGTKAKLATADRKNDLITTGKSDYSIFVDSFMPLGDLHSFATLGWTRKGDPSGVDYRDPFFASMGIGYRLTSRTTVGAFYDYREKITQHGAPVSESTFYLERKLGRDYKLQLYAVIGHSIASPDRGAGLTISQRF